MRKRKGSDICGRFAAKLFAREALQYFDGVLPQQHDKGFGIFFKEAKARVEEKLKSLAMKYEVDRREFLVSSRLHMLPGTGCGHSWNAVGI